MDISSQYDEFIKQLIRYWNNHKSVDLTEVDRLMDGIALAYLNAIREQRDITRKLFGLMDTLFYLQEYALRKAEKVNSPQDIDSLLLGLAAVSIEDARADFRDTLNCIEKLWVASQRAGIGIVETKGHFDRIAKVSNTESRYEALSTADLIQKKYYKAVDPEEGARDKGRKRWWRIW